MSEALRLAKELEAERMMRMAAFGFNYPLHQEAAAMLRQQAAEIERLRGLLGRVVERGKHEHR